MSFNFTGDGQGATVTTLPFVSEMQARGITPQTSSPVGSGPSDVFNVPVSPPYMTGTDTFVNPDAPYISLYDARR